MAENSAIQWTHHTFNPWRGCTKVHAGCTNCYAEKNYSVKMHGVKWGANGTRVRLSDAGWKEPLKWNREAAHAAIDHEAETNLGKDLGDFERPRVFCASLADIFEDWQGPVLDHHGKVLTAFQGTGEILPLDGGPDGATPMHKAITLDYIRRDLFKLIDATPNLAWLLLAKRPENVEEMWPHHPFSSRLGAKMHRRNVWLGTSISDQATADEWLPRIFRSRDLSPVLFASIEPLIGPIDLSKYLGGLNWVIVGGESGAGARPCDIRWMADIVGQCQKSSVPVFVKQLGSKPVNYLGEQLRFEDKKGGDLETFPSGLRVREFPNQPEVSHA